MSGAGDANPVEVLLFASLADLAGCSRETLALPRGAKVEDLWRRLVRDHPALGTLGYRPLVACDRSYASWDRALAGVREVAFLPPVSGG